MNGRASALGRGFAWKGASAPCSNGLSFHKGLRIAVSCQIHVTDLVSTLKNSYLNITFLVDFWNEFFLVTKPPSGIAVLSERLALVLTPLLPVWEGLGDEGEKIRPSPTAHQCL